MALGKVADGRVCRRADMQREVAAVSLLCEVLCSSPPRSIHARMEDPVLLFTDGACDPGEGRFPCVTIGACIFDPRGGGPGYFGVQVGEALLAHWAEKVDSQVIGQAELLPVLCALHAWAETLRSRPCLIFIDNDTARHGLMSGYSPVLKSAALISAMLAMLARLGSHAWFARVASASNIADDPSRLDFRVLEAMPGSRRVEPLFLGAAPPLLWPALARNLYGDA